MWESRRDLQGVWEGWKAALSFPGFPYDVISTVCSSGLEAKKSVETCKPFAKTVGGQSFLTS
jgi:hypothetical protein